MIRYSNIMATLAVFIALGGTSYAAIALERNSVKSRHIGAGQVRKSDLGRNAVASAQVRDGSLRAADFKPGELPAGPAGQHGANGAIGAAGANGADGATGAKGAPGAAGASGVVRVLDFDASWAPATLPESFGHTIVSPQACRTASYTAGAGETAVIQIAGMGAPNVQANDVLYINAMTSVDGGPMVRRNVKNAAESMVDGTAYASIVVRQKLESGRKYVFGAGFASNFEVKINPGTCFGVVTIAKEAT